nr:ABC transporter permease [Nitrosomonas nitrosa]
MLKLALRNIIRQKIHTTMTLAAIISGVAGIIIAGGWINDIYLQLGEALIRSQTGHLQVYKQGYFVAGTRSPEKYLIKEPDSVKKQIIEEVGVEKFDIILKRLNFSGLLNNGRSDLPIIGEGIQPDKEAKLGSSISIIAGRRLTNEDFFGIMLGKGVAGALKLKPGDYVTLLTNTLEGALNSLDFEVIGIFQSFSNDYDARAIKVPLTAAQELLGTQSTNALVALLKKTEDTDNIVAHLATYLNTAGLEAKTWIELNDFYEKTVEMYKGQFGVLQIIILLMVLLSVTNSINMSIFERVGEFGTMMALGNRSNHISQLILNESILLGVIGGSFGVGIGSLLALTISAIGIPMPPPPNADIGYTAQIQIVPPVLFMAFIIGLSATVLAALLPALHVSRIKVVDALRQNL